MNVYIINGPNLNMLGVRETSVYGSISFDTYLHELRAKFPQIHFHYRQSNIEGELINFIQEAVTKAEAVIINPAAYTHTSVGIGDALNILQVPVIEVHISNVEAREDFRKINHISASVTGTISGLGLDGYRLAVEYIIQHVGH